MRLTPSELNFASHIRELEVDFIWISPSAYEAELASGSPNYYLILPALRKLKVRFTPTSEVQRHLVYGLLQHTITNLDISMESRGPDSHEWAIVVDSTAEVFRRIRCAGMYLLQQLRLDHKDPAWLIDRPARREFEQLLIHFDYLRDIDLPPYLLSILFVTQLLCNPSVRNIKSRESLLPTPTGPGLWPAGKVWDDIREGIPDETVEWQYGHAQYLGTRNLTICSTFPALLRGVSQEIEETGFRSLKTFRMILASWAWLHPDQVFCLLNEIGRTCPAIEHIHIDNAYYHTTVYPTPEMLASGDIPRVGIYHLGPLANLPELKSFGLFWPLTSIIRENELLYLAPRFAKLTRLILDHPFSRAAYPEEPSSTSLSALAILAANCPHLVELSVCVSLTLYSDPQAITALVSGTLPNHKFGFQKLRVLELGMQFPEPTVYQYDTAARFLFNILPSECEIRTTRLHVAYSFVELWAGSVDDYLAQALWRSASDKLLHHWREIYAIMLNFAHDAGRRSARWAENHEPWMLGEDIFPSMF